MPTPSASPLLCFTDVELDHVEEDLALGLENRVRDQEEIRLVTHHVFSGLQKKGHTIARIRAMLKRLVMQGVLEASPHAHPFYQFNYATTLTQWNNYRLAKRSNGAGDAEFMRYPVGESKMGSLQIQRSDGRLAKRKRGRPQGGPGAERDYKLYLDWKAAERATGIRKRDFLRARGLSESDLKAIERGRARDKRSRPGQKGAAE